MHVALTSLLGCLLGVAIVAALVWDWWAHPDLAGPTRSRTGAATTMAAQSPSPAVPAAPIVAPVLATTAKRTSHSSPAAAPHRRLQPANA